MKSLPLLLALSFIAAASAQPLTPPGSGGGGAASSPHLYVNGVSVGNGADITQDTLQSMTIAAGKLASVGDIISIETGGVYAASTDIKAVRVLAGGQIIGSCSGNVAAVINWYVTAQLIKTGSNTQSYISACTVVGSNGNVRTGTLTLTDTATIAVLVTGQNSTNPVAGSITAQALVVDYWH